MSVKSGGQVYLSRDHNAPLVKEVSKIDQSAKYLMLVACRLWRSVSKEVRYVAINIRCSRSREPIQLPLVLLEHRIWSDFSCTWPKCYKIVAIVKVL